MLFKLPRLFAIAGLSCWLAACSTEENSANAGQAQSNIQLSAELQASYENSCKNCHEVPATNAPQTGDSQRWEQILEKGMVATLDRAINGYQGMPPGGQCFECNPSQLETLIRFMAQAKP